ncbi:hypothetical protein BJY52DRAFT_1228713 [Lactarius psammicola]|nr:hypothetical protein BJY52DRAFT_1228713 [Lactarius psammicola]
MKPQGDIGQLLAATVVSHSRGDTPSSKDAQESPSSGIVSCVVAFPDGRHIAHACSDNIRLRKAAEAGEVEAKGQMQFKIIPGYHGGMFLKCRQREQGIAQGSHENGGATCGGGGKGGRWWPKENLKGERGEVWPVGMGRKWKLELAAAACAAQDLMIPPSPGGRIFTRTPHNCFGNNGSRLEPHLLRVVLAADGGSNFLPITSRPQEWKRSKSPDVVSALY